MSQKLRKRIPILPGAHPTREDGMCAMELVAWLAGEEHSDEPACVCPILTAYVRAFNDLLPDTEARDQHLRPFLARLVNTRGSANLARDRAVVAADRSFRLFAPMRLTKLTRHKDAERLRALMPIDGPVEARAAANVLATLGPAVLAARWMANQLAHERPPSLWVTAAVHVIRTTGSWTGASLLLDDMLTIRDSTGAAR